MDYKSLSLLFVVKAIQLVDLSMDKNSAGSQPTSSDPRNRGILTRQSQITFFKDSKSRVNLKASKKRPAANAIFTPDFKFEDMGVSFIFFSSFNHARDDIAACLLSRFALFCRA